LGKKGEELYLALLRRSGGKKRATRSSPFPVKRKGRKKIICEFFLLRKWKRIKRQEGEDLLPGSLSAHLRGERELEIPPFRGEEL